jgi:hypothetical protein
MTDIGVWFPVAGAAVSALVGIVSGVALAAWWVSRRDHEHMQLINDVKNIKDSCPVKHVELMTHLKEAVCAGFKLAIKELGSDFDKKLADRDAKLAGNDKAIAVLEERMKQTEADIESIFVRMNKNGSGLVL